MFIKLFFPDIEFVDKKKMSVIQKPMPKPKLMFQSFCDYKTARHLFKLTLLLGPGQGREESAGFQPPASLDFLHQSHTHQCAPPWPPVHKV